jgi:uncharacterized protein (DUF2141 family)
MLIGPVILALAAIGAAANAAPVHVVLQGVQPRGGNVLLEVQTRQQYTQVPFAAGSIVKGDAGGTLQFDYDLAPGEYAVSVIHDANGDFQLNATAAGIPQEGVASSGLGVGLKGGRASFDEAAFTVTPKGAVVTMTMRYPD